MSGGFNHWASLANAIQAGCEQAVDATAETAVGYIQQKIEANGQVDTGEMRDSAYHKSQRGSTYKSSAHALDEIPAPDSAEECDVAMAAAHSVFQEFGTIFQAGKPFFEPGMEQAKKEFEYYLGYYVVSALEDAAR